jgi:hypothetical protein
MKLEPRILAQGLQFRANFDNSRLINTPLQRGGQTTGDASNRFSGFHCESSRQSAWETAEAVQSAAQRIHTPLKRGVNENRWGIVALALLVGLSGCGKPSGNNGGKPDAALTARLEAIRQAGQPVTLAELNAWYPEPPAGENAAPLYADAFAALTVADAKSLSFLPKNQPALALLHKASAKSQCRYPIDLSEGALTLLPHLAKIKTCAQLLSKETVANAAKGRVDLAAQDVMDGLRLAGSLEQEPVQISQLVRISSDALTQSGLEGALGLKPFTEEQLARLQAALAQEEGTIGPSLTRSFAAARCMVISLLHDGEGGGLRGSTASGAGRPRRRTLPTGDGFDPARFAGPTGAQVSRRRSGRPIRRQAVALQEPLPERLCSVFHRPKPGGRRRCSEADGR